MRSGEGAARCRRSLLLFLLAIVLTSCSAMHLIRTAIHDHPSVAPPKPGTADDASRMNETTVEAIIDVSPDDAIAIEQIRAAFTRARAAHLGVSIAGFRHSMGGQTIAPHGIVLNMLPHNRMELRPGNEILHVQSGAVWKDVIRYLESASRSVEVMQSDSPFSVGGSLSVNCHGWQALHAPIASTVVAMTVMRPDGTVVHCSASENPDLFHHILGGYGLFAVILDADLHTVKNERYRMTHQVCDVDSYERLFDEKVHGHAEVAMAYGRISVAPESFLREAIITTYEREAGPVPVLREEGSERFARLVFRGSVGSDSGKTLRWRLERRLASIVEPRHISRNQLMSHSIELYVDHGAETTDILQEYFVPRGKLAPFIASIRPLLHRENIDLLNLTIRDLQKDDVTALPYAREDALAIVMFFNEKRSAAADAAMQQLTRELIEKVLEAGGTYYLPYRLHATPEQLQRAYPTIGEFFREKRRIDPDEVLVNEWYSQYGHAFP